MCMKRHSAGFTLVEILIVTMVIGLLTTILIPNMMRIKLLANETAAKATLKSIAIGFENYANDYNQYPDDPMVLVDTDPAYLLKDYFSGVYHGYTYSSKTSSFAYQVTATPINSNAGSQNFMILTGAVFAP